MTFVDAILLKAKARDKRPLLIEMHGGKQLPTSGRSFVTAVAQVRGYLKTQGVARGDRIGLLGPNSAHWAVMDLAILAQGAVCVPLYSRQDPKQLANMLVDAEAKLLLVSDAELQSAIAPHLPSACSSVLYEEALGGSACEDAVATGPSDAVTIVYTSGTSGEPKGVVMNAGNVDFMLDVTGPRISRMTGSGRAEDRVFHYLPFCFAGSRIMLWSQLQRGNPLWMSTDLNKLQDELRGAKPHYFLNVPVLLERIKNGVDGRLRKAPTPLRVLYLRALATAAQPPAARRPLDRVALRLAQRVLFPRIKRLIGENLEFLVCGSAPLSAETQLWFNTLGLPIYQVYGLTETTGIVSIDDTDHVQIGRVGHPVPGCELKVSERGELLCRGPNVFTGYFKRPDATAEILQDGWFHTGDQVELESDGSLKIIGRLKDVLVPESGHNVAPAPIENRLEQAAAGIEQAVVVGHGRPFLTALVTGPIAAEELDAVVAEVNHALPHYQRLRKVRRLDEVFTPDNGLLTANQKLKRQVIEERYRDTIEEMYR